MPEPRSFWLGIEGLIAPLRRVTNYDSRLGLIAIVQAVHGSL